MNNRQGGRRRGRGGQRPQGLGGGGGNNRDQRSRGNAAQLLEKYKNMARDAQLAGDRVQTEYYLQFADHYFRVLSETRSRFEDQRQSRDDEDEGDEEDQFDGEGEEEISERPDRSERQPRGDRAERFERRDRDERPRRDREGDRDSRPRRERIERRPAREEDEGAEAEPQQAGIADFLPPAIGVTTDAVPPIDDVEDAPRPRRRTRRPRVEDNDEGVAPAA